MVPNLLQYSKPLSNQTNDSNPIHLNTPLRKQQPSVNKKQAVPIDGSKPVSLLHAFIIFHIN